MPSRTEAFRYRGFDVDQRNGILHCRYALDEWQFEEQISFDATGEGWEGAEDAARIVALLAGVSYFKAGAPPVIDLGEMPVRNGEAEFLRRFYIDGLGEFAYRNGLTLDDVKVIGGTPIHDGARIPAGSAERPLIPFGGGVDSIVTVELLRPRFPDAALFVLSRAGDTFAAIERAAAVTGLPIVRASRRLDEKILRSDELGFFNGHVPVTGILSAIAVLAAVLDGRGAVVMSNEWSASSANLRVGDRVVNHQYSKSLAFEEDFRAMVGPAFRYFSVLRPFSELWIASRFAEMRAYHPVFHSCNRAFHIDPAHRRSDWCGECDKCCFIDLILSPFLATSSLEAVFGGSEPLANPALLDQFRTLLEVGGTTKPFECVGDVDECRVAVALASARPDRAGNQILADLMTELDPDTLAGAARLLAPIGTHHIPDEFFPDLA